MVSLLFILCLALGMVNCSDSSETVYKKRKPDVQESNEWKLIKADVQKYCGTCHNGSVHPLSFSSESAWEGSKANARIANDTMPPNAPLPDDVKSRFTGYFK